MIPGHDFETNNATVTTEDGELQRCAGLPFVECRTLGQDERASVRRRAARLRWMALAVLLAEFGSFATIVMLFSRLPSTPTPQLTLYEEMLLGVAAVVVFVGLPASLVAARRFFVKGRLFSRALGDGSVLQFKGHINWGDWTDRSVANLVRRKCIAMGEEGEYTLEVYSGAPILYSLNGAAVRNVVPVEITRAASRPQSPVELAVPASWYEAPPPENIERRRQSASETDELMTYASQFPNRAAVLRYGAAHMLAAVVVAGMAWSHRTELGTLGAAVFLTGAIVYLVNKSRLLIRAKRLSRLYLADANLGWVLIAKPKEEGQSLTAITEFLPISGLVWTIAGRPAGWRNRR